jgi:hypothetical protein
MTSFKDIGSIDLSLDENGFLDKAVEISKKDTCLCEIKG